MAQDYLNKLAEALARFSVYDTSKMNEFERRFVIHCEDMSQKVVEYRQWLVEKDSNPAAGAYA